MLDVSESLTTGNYRADAPCSDGMRVLQISEYLKISPDGYNSRHFNEAPNRIFHWFKVWTVSKDPETDDTVRQSNETEVFHDPAARPPRNMMSLRRQYQHCINDRGLEPST
jgi:hypothetical protein